uniref:Uncharacterized protein n=1 Tax=Anguilla anguilla TaxID=7936 RepID=A0A0E9W9H4_ANGAN
MSKTNNEIDFQLFSIINAFHESNLLKFCNNLNYRTFNTLGTPD